MAKSLFLLIIANLIGVMVNPLVLTATDTVVVNGLNTARVVETVPLPEPEPEPEPVKASTPVAPAVVAVETPKAPQTVNYTVTVQTNSMIANGLSYSDIYKFRKLVYGHNSWNLLGNLVYRYAGENFTITENGVATNYRVAEVAIYEKTADGSLNGDKRLMARIANSAMGHSIALMTCSGTPLGNGDATHRLVVFADAI